MTKADFHVHTNFCDGKNTPEEMVQAALSLGMTAIGFSVHSYTFFDTGYCIAKEKMADYIEEINRLKDKYRGKILILCGAERDFYAEEPEGDLDYTIGSLHYVKKNGVYYAVDESKEALQHAIDTAWEGDALAFAEEYYAALATLAKNKPNVIGHFDLLTKFNEPLPLFDESHPRYRKAAFAAVDALLPLDIPFEINTGAISRRYRTTPYPAPFLLSYLIEKGAKLMLSSDAHSASGLLFAFEEWEAFAQKLGATSFYRL